MTLTVVYDLDGVLIDSASLVKSAYLRAGVVCPDDILEREGDDWLWHACKDPRGARRLKNVYYTRDVHLCAHLPPYRTAVRLAAEGGDMVLQCVMSGAPIGSLRHLRHHRTSWPFYGICIDGIRTREKMAFIKTMKGPGVYVDDQKKFIDLPPDWRFIHYIGQTADELLEEIIR